MEAGAGISALLQNGLETGLWQGAEALVARGDSILYHQTVARPDKALPCARPGVAVWDVASLTKPVATASLLLAMELPLTAKLRDFLPAFGSGDSGGGGGKDMVTLHDLATHRGGLAPDYRFIDSCPDAQAARECLLAMGLQYTPRRQVVYSCLGYLLLGLVLETVGGASLERLFRQHIAWPLGLADSGYLPLENGIAPTRIMPTGPREHNRDGRAGVVHDSSAFVFGGAAGNAGLFATATDLHRYAAALVAGRTGFDAAAMFANASQPGHVARSIGWEYKAKAAPVPSIGPDFPDGAIGHTGFTGTMLWLDRQSGLIAILLSNRTACGGRTHGAAAMARLRRDFGKLACALAKASV